MRSHRQDISDSWRVSQAAWLCRTLRKNRMCPWLRTTSVADGTAILRIAATGGPSRWPCNRRAAANAEDFQLAVSPKGDGVSVRRDHHGPGDITAKLNCTLEERLASDGCRTTCGCEVRVARLSRCIW